VRELAPSFSQTLRVGAIDGLYAQIDMGFAFSDGRWEFSTTHARVQLPVGRLGWIVVRGSGGQTGHGHGEVGLRRLVAGNGGSGSFFITPSVGGGGLFREADDFEEYNVSGPSFGLTLEYRP
jgi:hypothetical protein